MATVIATEIELFTGIAGITLGLERAGWKPIAFSEVKPSACAVLARQYPQVPNLGDITTIDWRDVARPSLLCGGFPCQDLSHVHTNGKRRGLDGPKSGLWRYFRDAVAALEPRWVLVENVETWRSWVSNVRADLAQLGYASVSVELSAGSFGAPHRRPRVFVVAHADGESEPLLAIHEEVAELRPLSGRDSWDWRDPPPRPVPLDDGVSAWVDNDLYGNAVVPAVACWLGDRMIAYETAMVA